MVDFVIESGQEPQEGKTAGAVEQIINAARGKAPNRSGDWDEVFRLLRKHDVDPNTAVWNGLSLLTFAATEPAPGACRTLIKMGANRRNGGTGSRTPLMEAIRMRDKTWGSGHRQVVELLASTINDRDGDGKTALMFASVGAGVFGSKRGRADIIKQLVSLGADLSITDHRGRTALMHAVASNEASEASTNTEVVRLLQTYSVDEAARQWFEGHCRAEFSPTGEMVVVPRKAAAAVPGKDRESKRDKTVPRAARADARIRTIAKKIEDHFGVPEGCVALTDPKGRHLRGEDTIGILRKKHGG